MVVKIRNPEQKEGPSKISAILVSYQFSESHSLKENPPVTVRAKTVKKLFFII